jgi:Na+/proline symporter
MLPPMIYRVINPSLQGIDAEGAYMMLCQKVLPAGLIGLVLSGMISATASKANTTINTAAVIFAHDIYKGVIHKTVGEKRLILVARLFTVLFGLGTIIIAILIPYAGGIVEVVLSTAAIAGGSLFAPVIFSLFSKRQTSLSLVAVSIISLVVSLFFKMGAPFLLQVKLSRAMETAVGVGVPLGLLLLYEVYARSQNIVVPYLQSEGENKVPGELSQEALQQNQFGIQVITLSTAFVGLGILILGMVAERGGVAAMIGGVILAVSLLFWFKAKVNQRRSGTKETITPGHQSRQAVNRV